MTESTQPYVPPGPLHHEQLLLGTLVLSLATFMNVLDSSIANVSIPAIAGDVGVSPNQGTWIITSFAVSNAISMPLTGWLTQRFGMVRLFTLSVVLFVLASLLCGMASNLGMLIVFRVVQGLVAGPMIPLSQSLLLQSYPKQKAGVALAIWAMTTLVAPIMGPLLGGWITDNMSWPWIFFINVPFGLFSAIITWNIYKTRESPTRKLPIDAVGLASLVVWVGALQIMLDKGKELDWFASPEIIVLGFVALIGFVFFLIWELSEDHPVVDLHLFSGRNFWVGTLVLSLGYGIVFGNIVLLPLWLQQYMGYTATWAGIILAPTGLLAILLSPYVGKTIHKTDPRIYATISFITFGFVLWLRSRFNTEADISTLMIPTIVQGIAMAFFFVPLVTLTLSGLEPDRIPAATGLSNFARITAGAFGTSITTTLWENRAALHHAQLAESINNASIATQQSLANISVLGMSREQGMFYLNRLIDQQAFTLGANDIFAASATLFFALVGIVWLAKPVAGATMDSSDAH